jgi:hypothetical protein
MGFRSTVISEDTFMDWPEWFVEKYKGMLHLDRSGPLASRYESKAREGLVDDVSKAVVGKFSKPFVLVFLHECGGITRVQIDPDGTARYSEPEGWKNTSGSTHCYCYGCSDVQENKDD